MKEARFWHPLTPLSPKSPQGKGAVRCELCPHRCTIAPGNSGRCGSRINRDGTLYSAVYGHPCALAIDPVEKKPLLHFHPGTTCLSLSCIGCNFRCPGCQNWEISQARPDIALLSEGTASSHGAAHGTDGGEGDFWSPEDIVAAAIKYRCPSLAYTYTEPLTYFEYIYDISFLARQNGLYNILVSAGYVNPEPLAELAPLLGAANIDLKAFSDEIYRCVCGGTLQPVLDTLLYLHAAGVHLEITNLVIPGINDDPQMIRQMCRWLSEHDLGGSPLHFSRFFPHYKLSDRHPTPVKTLREAERIAREEGISTVHLGNV